MYHFYTALAIVASCPHEWSNKYLPILEEALGRHCVLPARKISSVKEFKRLYPGVQEVILDGAERPIQRPKNNKNQKKAYSGKKKRHTRNNIYLVNKGKKILYFISMLQDKFLNELLAISHIIREKFFY